MDSNAIIQQSKAAYGQWCELWRDHAKRHSALAPFKPLSDFINSGVGKACLLVANGYTFEENLETIKEHQGNVDILCCDKTLGHLIDNGITPTFCLVCDAQVNYEKYLKPWEDKLQDTILFMNVCANPKWSFNGNWKDRYFFVNHDAIRSEVEFCSISKCPNMIPAGTNVSNAMVVFLAQSDNTGRRNFFGYDKILLIGFDYCWRFGKKYYAFDNVADGKTNYMRHIFTNTLSGSPAYTSTNLAFSAGWLEKYVGNFRLPVVQCTRETILQIKYRGELAEQMQYNFRREDASVVGQEMARQVELSKKISESQAHVKNIGREHYYNFLATV